MPIQIEKLFSFSIKKTFLLRHSLVEVVVRLAFVRLIELDGRKSIIGALQDGF